MEIILILVTITVSILSLRDYKLFDKLSFKPFVVSRKHEVYRIITHSFVHADYIHLGVNMLVLWSFSRSVTYNMGTWEFLLVYFTSVAISSLPSLFRYSNNQNYVSVGASGGVAAIVFASIYFNPMRNVYLFAALPIPGFIFGILYLVYSFYMSRKNMDNINHEAHFAGAVAGYLFALILS